MPILINLYILSLKLSPKYIHQHQPLKVFDRSTSYCVTNFLPLFPCCGPKKEILSSVKCPSQSPKAPSDSTNHSINRPFNRQEPKDTEFTISQDNEISAAPPGSCSARIYWKQRLVYCTHTCTTVCGVTHTPSDNLGVTGQTVDRLPPALLTVLVRSNGSPL